MPCRAMGVRVCEYRVPETGLWTLNPGTPIPWTVGRDLDLRFRFNVLCDGGLGCTANVNIEFYQDDYPELGWQVWRFFKNLDPFNLCDPPAFDISNRKTDTVLISTTGVWRFKITFEYDGFDWVGFTPGPELVLNVSNLERTRSIMVG